MSNTYKQTKVHINNFNSSLFDGLPPNKADIDMVHRRTHCKMIAWFFIILAFGGYLVSLFIGNLSLVALVLPALFGGCIYFIVIHLSW